MKKKERLERQQQRQLERDISDAANVFLDQGLSVDKIINKLVKKGIDQETTERVVVKLSQKRKKIIRDEAVKGIIIGSIFCFGGLALTVASLQAMNETGGYVVTWGAILYGGIQLLQGLYTYCTAK